MVLIEWREEYCTGIEGVDHEHENLIAQINSVYALVDKRADRQVLVESLGDRGVGLVTAGRRRNIIQFHALSSTRTR